MVTQHHGNSNIVCFGEKKTNRWIDDNPQTLVRIRRINGLV